MHRFSFGAPHRSSRTSPVAHVAFVALVALVAACSSGASSQSPSGSPGVGTEADGGTPGVLPSGAVGEQGECSTLAPSQTPPVHVQSLTRRGYKLGSLFENKDWNDAKVVVSGTPYPEVGGAGQAIERHLSVTELSIEPSAFFYLGGLMNPGNGNESEGGYYYTGKIDKLMESLAVPTKSLIGQVEYEGNVAVVGFKNGQVTRTAAGAGLPQGTKYLASVQGSYYTGLAIYFDVPSDCVHDALIKNDVNPLEFFKTRRNLTNVERLLRQGDTAMRIEVVTTLKEGSLDDLVGKSTCATGHLQGCLDLIDALDKVWKTANDRFQVKSSDGRTILENDDPDLLTVPELSAYVPTK